MDYRTYQDVAREYAREDKDPRDVFSKFLSDGLGSPKNFPAFDKIFTPRLAEKTLCRIRQDAALTAKNKQPNGID